jgi:uncharacterized protein YyaL (SSP411 family)
MRQEMLENPFGYGHLLLAADSYLDGAAAVVLVGRGEERVAFLAERRRRFAPTWAWTAIDPEVGVASVLSATAEGKGRVEGKPAAYLCRHFACELPLTEPQKLAERLQNK